MVVLIHQLIMLQRKQLNTSFCLPCIIWIATWLFFHAQFDIYFLERIQLLFCVFKQNFYRMHFFLPLTVWACNLGMHFWLEIWSEVSSQTKLVYFSYVKNHFVLLYMRRTEKEFFSIYWKEPRLKLVLQLEIVISYCVSVCSITYMC